MKNASFTKNKKFMYFYNELPEVEFGYEEFNKLFLARLKMLKDFKKNKFVNSKFTEHEDLNSHFICRLVLASDAKTKKWFINIETELLRFRLEYLDLNNNFTMPFTSCKNNLEIGPLNSQYDTLDINLDSKYFLNNNKSDLVTESRPKKYKMENKLLVHFSRVSQLLASRSIVPNKGYVNLNIENRKHLIANQWKLELENKMRKVELLLKKEPDDRFESMRKHVFVEDLAIIKDKSSIFEHGQCFPPCISKILDLLKTNSHIKNNDRQTLALFLKDIKVPLAEAINFFRLGFKLSVEEFDKNYLYSIRHAYGLEGKMANYPSYNCYKMADRKNSQNKSSCPCTDDPDYISNTYCINIEDIGNTYGRCAKVFEKNAEVKNAPKFYSPKEFFRLQKEINAKKKMHENEGEKKTQVDALKNVGK